MKTHALFSRLSCLVIVSLVFAASIACLRSHGTTGDGGAVILLEQKIEEAIVRGDVAFVDRVTSADFSFVHGDGWTQGAVR